MYQHSLYVDPNSVTFCNSQVGSVLMSRFSECHAKLFSIAHSVLITTGTTTAGLCYNVYFYHIINILFYNSYFSNNFIIINFIIFI